MREREEFFEGMVYHSVCLELLVTFKLNICEGDGLLETL